MIDSGRTYEAENALWLKTTSFEDLGHGIKGRQGPRDEEGRRHLPSYFVPDVAYHLAKFERGFTKAVNIQGTDHHGTIARVRAGLQAAGSVMGLAIPKEFPEYILHKMLSVIKDGEPVKMSKRSGNYVTLHDLVEWAGRDAARFFLVPAQERRRIRLRRDARAAKERREPGLLPAVRPCAHLLGLREGP